MLDTHLIEIARGLTGIIRENITAGEARAQIVPEVVAAVGRAGLFRLCAPKEVGGLEADPQTCISVMEVIASADPAVAWYIANSTPACLIAASLPVDERDELFADRDANFGNSGVRRNWHFSGHHGNGFLHPVFGQFANKKRLSTHLWYKTRPTLKQSQWLLTQSAATSLAVFSGLSAFSHARLLAEAPSLSNFVSNSTGCTKAMAHTPVLTRLSLAL